MISKFRNEHAYLSNFADTLLYYDGIRYTSVETAFQANKTLDIELRKRIARYTPKEAKKAGRHLELRPDWSSIKDQIMYELVRQKFSSDDFGYKSKLLATGDEYIEEDNSWGDTYWGVCKGKGENKLGKILMRVRSELKGDSYD